MQHVFSLWPSLAELASDLGQKYVTVNAWRQRGSIPAKFDLDLIEAAAKRGKTLTLEELASARRVAAKGEAA